MDADAVPEPIPRRRTQAERREATRAVLLEATVQCLVEHGYSGTTTLEIERRAGVSRGARIHHYPTKAALLADAIDHLYSRLGAHYETAFGPGQAHANDAERLRSGLHLLWSVYSGPSYLAVLELTTAARTDEELCARLREVAEHHRQLALAAAAHYFGLEGETAARVVDSIHAALLGMRMQRNVKPDAHREHGVLSMLEQMVIAHLPVAGGASAPSARESGGDVCP